MEYTGLFNGYPVGRLLSDADARGHVDQRSKWNVLPHPHLGTISINGTYLELVGKFYDAKGLMAAVMLGLAGVGVVGVGMGVLIAIGAAGSDDQRFVVVPAAFMAAAVLALTAALVWGFLREAFRLTHYPIRLNRKTRKVYAFDARTLEVIEADWDKLFFTIVPTRTRPIGLQEWEILGHVMDDDQVTVRRTIPFSIVWPGKSDVERHWEYMRRYMEEGPESIIDHTPVCLPIADRKESPWFGFLILFAPMSSPLLFIPGAALAFIGAIGRYIAMQTSKIPEWPAHIEAECQIGPDDPYAIDAKDNPPDFWKSTDKLRSELVAEGVIAR